MAGETVITVVGNIVNDPEMRYTNSGAGVASFRIASTPRTLDRQSGEWKDGEALFLTCNIWREPAENVVQSLTRGARVIVQGRLRQRSYETKEGEKRSSYELEVDEIGPSLRYATATIQKATRSSGGGGQQRQGGQQQAGASFDDPWATQGAQPSRRFGGQPSSEEPPF
jgi:single-strand DNA-binding protein